LSRAGAARAPCLRESPIAMRLEDGSVIEGVPDLAFEEADGWTVIDFKTDANITGREVPYRKQVALYAQAITAATKKQTTGCLLLI
jgi:ATP-dependent helicase/nuclease subunit A